ncbi:MAG: glycosyltransferase, partial [Blastocatellia bacterium]
MNTSATKVQLTTAPADSARARFREERVRHWDRLAVRMDTWQGLGGYYHQRLAEVYRFLISPGQRVLEIGCGRGDLLAALSPAYGMGIDFSPGMIARARTRYPELSFQLADSHDLVLDEQFDVIILSDLINDLRDVQDTLERLRPLTHDRTRIILNFYSRLWELPLALATRLRLAGANLYQNWLAPDDVVNLLNLADFEVIRQWQEILCPLRIPLLTRLCNRVLARLWPIRELALTNFIVARPRPQAAKDTPAPKVSVLVPARNEAGNIPRIFERVPEMGAGTELIFVEGHSSDNTWETIRQQIAAHPERSCLAFQQTGKGKGDAVRLGFSKATGDILMILDADMTVPPEDLPRFYEALHSGKGEFINGVRLVYPMEKE